MLCIPCKGVCLGLIEPVRQVVKHCLIAHHLANSPQQAQAHRTQNVKTLQG